MKKMLTLGFVFCVVWLPIAATWHGGDNLEPGFVLAWSIVASFAVMFTVWATWMAATHRPEPVPVPIRPRNRRIR